MLLQHLILYYDCVLLRFLKISDQFILMSGNILNCDLSFLSYIYLHISFHFLPVKPKDSRFDYLVLGVCLYNTASF